jgi:hypothetical protein
MTRYYTTEEARAKLGEIIQAAIANKPSVITYHGVPAAIVSGFPFVRFPDDADSGTATESHHTV